MKKIFKINVLIVCMVILGATVTFGYTIWGFGHNEPTIYMNDIDLDAYYLNSYYDAIRAWNGTNTKAVIINKDQGNHIHEIYNEAVNDSYIAQFSGYWWTLSGRCTTFGIVLNDNKLMNLNKSTNYVQSVIVHEFGHAFCLADNPPESPSIMRYDRNRETVIEPCQDDIDGVNNAY